LANSASFWSPEGDLANGLVILGLYSDANPPPSNTPDVVQIDMPDGATIAYDHAAHALAVTLPAGGTATIPPPPAAQPSTARSPSTMMCRSPALPPQPMM
jgi:phage baseplate assembly protein V